MSLNDISGSAVDDFDLAPGHRRGLARCFASFEKSVALQK